MLGTKGNRQLKSHRIGDLSWRLPRLKERPLKRRRAPSRMEAKGEPPRAMATTSPRQLATKKPDHKPRVTNRRLAMETAMETAIAMAIAMAMAMAMVAQEEAAMEAEEANQVAEVVREAQPRAADLANSQAHRAMLSLARRTAN